MSGNFEEKMDCFLSWALIAQLLSLYQITPLDHLSWMLKHLNRKLHQQNHHHKNRTLLKIKVPPNQQTKGFFFLSRSSPNLWASSCIETSVPRRPEFVGHAGWKFGIWITFIFWENQIEEGCSILLLHDKDKFESVFSFKIYLFHWQNLLAPWNLKASMTTLA